MLDRLSLALLVLVQTLLGWSCAPLGGAVACGPVLIAAECSSACLSDEPAPCGCAATGCEDQCPDPCDGGECCLDECRLCALVAPERFVAPEESAAQLTRWLLTDGAGSEWRLPPMAWVAGRESAWVRRAPVPPDALRRARLCVWVI
ncbi:MAG TPA: hypothetical protein DEB06_04590 [Phycisphaerales bacterium]|nr:hypothetical protein [Phycisphaerales bacterium]